MPKHRRLPLALLLLLLGVPAGPQAPELPDGGPDPGAGEPELEETGIPAPDFVEPPPEEPLPGPRWFRSNAAGMALEENPSRLAALRNEYALGLDYMPPESLPEILVPWYAAPWRVEVHILYQNGAESRRQWIFRDPDGTARLVAVFDQDLLNLPPLETPAEAAAAPAAETPAEPAAETAAGPAAAPAAGALAGLMAGDGGDGAAPEASGPAAEAPAEPAAEPAAGPAAEMPAEPAAGEAAPRRVLTGFIERYNQEGQIIAEHLFLDGGEEARTGFFYRQRQIVRAEMRRKFQTGEGDQELPVYTDWYRYSRSASLRAVERVYHEGAEAASPVQLRFPRLALDAAAGEDFISPGASYATGFPDEYTMGDGYRSVFTTDSRGRILTETRQNNQGTVIAELVNTWSGNRLSSVLLKAGDDVRLTEYEYNSRGDRILERNYRNGTLERLVRNEGRREVEELFMNGVVILRAIWEDGRKISEERVRPGR